MTEEEAKTKWCPFARVEMYVRGVVGRGCNRIVTDDHDLNEKIQVAINGTGGTKCIGSACMAWRWRVLGSDLGWCGLGGKP